MIYLVEDDISIQELVIYTLQNTGFEAKGFSSAENFWANLKGKKPSLVILDIMLPGEDGLTILKRLRSNSVTQKLPIIIMTAKSSEYDKVHGLDMGADDYISKPVGMMELVARVKNLLRRSSYFEEKNIYKVGNLSLDLLKHQVTVNGISINLTLKEFDLLTCLMKNEGIVFTRDQLISKVWNFDFEGETRTVDTHILTLRNKLGACGELIQTVRGVGYKVVLL